MTTTVTGLVQNVIRGKQFTTKFGAMVTYKIELDTDEGILTVQKNGMADKNFSIAIGTNVQATYEEQQVQTKSGDTFTNNKLVKDGLIILAKDGTQQSVGSSGEAKPLYAAGQHVAKSSSNQPQTVNQLPKSTGYSNEGARNGMIVNASLALATARKDVSTSALIKAADDIKALTQYVETGVLPVLESLNKSGTDTLSKSQMKRNATSSLGQKPQAHAAVQEFNEIGLDDEDPFE